jgi:hypothetical protein
MLWWLRKFDIQTTCYRNDEDVGDSFYAPWVKKLRFLALLIPLFIKFLRQRQTKRRSPIN